MRSLAHAARGFVRSTGVGDERKLQLLRGFFGGAAGALDGKLQPQSLKRGELVLVSAGERWREAGERGSEQLRHRLNRLFGEEVVSRIVVRPGKPAVSKSSIRAKRHEDRHPAEVSEDVLNAADAIGNERLRRAFIGLAKKIAVVNKPEGRSD